MAEAVKAVVAEVVKFFGKEAIKQAAIKIAVAIAVNAAARMLQPKSKDQSADRSSRFQKRRDSSPYRDVILGTALTAGTFIDAIAYSTDNMFYCEIIKLADHECDGLVAAYAGGRQLTINGDGSVQEYIEGSTPRMWIYFQAGAWGETTHSEVLTAFGGRYTSNDRGRGVCRVVIKCDMRSDKLFPSRSPPDLTFAVRGAKIYSPRLDTSLGGSHVWGTYGSYAWTDNLADIAYNVARGIFVYGGASPERLAGGSYDSEELPLAQWAAESTACEVAVSLKAGGTERRYRGGLIFSTNDELEGMLSDLAAGAAGYCLDLGGTLIFQAGVARTPVATLTDSDFIAGKLRRTWRQAARERFNTVTGRFTDPALRYNQNTLPIRRSTSDITADNNEERVETMSLGVVQSQTQGQRVMEIRRRSNRLNAMFQVELPPRWQHLEAGDWVTYISARRGWTKTFVLLPAELKTTGEDMLVSGLSMVEVSSNVYTWTPASDELDVTNPATVGPGSIPDATISGFTAVASANTATNESAPAIEVAWTVPSDPTIDTVAIDYKRPSATPWLTQSFDAQLGAGQITGLASGNWMVRARPITTPLRPGTASGTATVTLTQIIAGEAGAGIGGAPILNSQVTGFANQAIDTEFNYFDRTWNALFASAGTWTVSKFVALGATQVLRRAAAAPPAGAQFNIGQALAASLPVQEGQRLEASAIVSPTNCTPASNLQVSWFNAAGSFVGATPVANSNGDSVVGGFVTVPSGIGAAIASLTAVFIVNTGGVYTEGRFARPFLRIASADQSVLTAYTPGPVERNANQGGTIGTDIRLPDNSVAPIGRVDNAYNPLGENQVVNSDLNQGTVGFEYTGSTNFTGTGVSSASGRNLVNYPNYFGARNVFWSLVQTSSGNFTGGSYMDGWQQLGINGPSLANLRRYATIVTPGERVYYGAKVAVHGMTNATVALVYYDRDGATLTSAQSGGNIGDARLGGPSGAWGLPANFAQLDAFATVPANAAFAALYVYGSNLSPSQGSAYIFACDYFVAKVGADQTTAPVYKAGPVDRAADRTGENTAGAIAGQGNQATANRYRQSTAPPSPVQWDEWIDTSTSPALVKVRLSGAWETIGEEGADVTAQATPILEGPASVSFDVDGAGALSPGSQVPRTLQFIRKRGGTDVSASTTWSIVSTSNITLGTITNGGVNITAVAAGVSSFTVRSVRDGVTIDQVVNIAKNTIASGGGGGAKIARDDTATGIASGTYNAVLSGTINSGPAGLARVELNYLPLTWSGSSSNFQFRLTRAGVQLAETGIFNGIDGAGDIGDFLTEIQNLAGFYTVAAGTAVWALEAKRTSGSGTINTAAGELVVSQTET